MYIFAGILKIVCIVDIVSIVDVIFFQQGHGATSESPPVIRLPYTPVHRRASVTSSSNSGQLTSKSSLQKEKKIKKVLISRKGKKEREVNLNAIQRQ